MVSRATSNKQQPIITSDRLRCTSYGLEWLRVGLRSASLPWRTHFTRVVDAQRDLTDSADEIDRLKHEIKVLGRALLRAAPDDDCPLTCGGECIDGDPENCDPDIPKILDCWVADWLMQARDELAREEEGSHGD